MKLDSICVCDTKPSVNDELLKCHSLDCQNGKYFHLNCLDYKWMPNDSQTTWLCSSCKVKAGWAKGKSAKSIPRVSTNTDSHLFGSCLVNDASDRFHTSNNPNDNMSKAAFKNGSVSINTTTCSSTTSFSNNVPVLPLPAVSLIFQSRLWIQVTLGNSWSVCFKCQAIHPVLSPSISFALYC